MVKQVFEYEDVGTAQFCSRYLTNSNTPAKSLRVEV
jgi:hypothetical protein